VGKRRWGPAAIAQLESAVAAGRTLKDAAAAIGMSYNTAADIARRERFGKPPRLVAAPPTQAALPKTQLQWEIEAARAEIEAGTSPPYKGGF
jgi:hypothetical protein